MKKWFVLVLALMIAVSLVACAHSDDHGQDETTGSGSGPEVVYDNYGSDVSDVHIRMSGIYFNPGETKIVVTWNNESTGAISFNKSFELQRLEGGEWVNCISVMDETGARTVAAGNSTNSSFILTDEYDLTVPGPYRFLTTCMVLNINGTQESCTLWAQFIVK